VQVALRERDLDAVLMEAVPDPEQDGAPALVVPACGSLIQKHSSSSTELSTKPVSRQAGSGCASTRGAARAASRHRRIAWRTSAP
jgi:hypothetical protein